MKRWYSQHGKHLAPRLYTGKGILGSREKDRQTDRTKTVENENLSGPKGEKGYRMHKLL